MPVTQPHVRLHESTAPAAQASSWRDFLALTKPEITFLVAITTVAGFLLAPVAQWQASVFWAALVGTVLTSAGACVLNHVAEYRLDAAMKRTAGRPLPSGRVDVDHAFYMGVALAGAGIGLLCPLTNSLTATLAILTVLLYVYVYTPLKRATWLNTWVGTLPGALPALGGYTAVTGTIGWEGLLLFGILLAWQIPHFLSLAWMYRHDYARGGFAMITSANDGIRRTRWHMLVWSVIMLLFTILLGLQAQLGWIYFAGIALVSIPYGRSLLHFLARPTGTRARGVLKATVYVIPAVVLLIGLARFTA
jgi:protoheme IX farnesyltransferase